MCPFLNAAGNEASSVPQRCITVSFMTMGSDGSDLRQTQRALQRMTMIQQQKDHSQRPRTAGMCLGSEAR